MKYGLVLILPLPLEKDLEAGYKRAKFVGSSTSNGGGVLMVPTAQKRQPLVHSWPAIINVASPLAQQSWMFGQRASWQTV